MSFTEEMQDRKENSLSLPGNEDFLAHCCVVFNNNA